MFGCLDVYPAALFRMYFSFSHVHVSHAVHPVRKISRLCGLIGDLDGMFLYQTVSYLAEGDLIISLDDFDGMLRVRVIIFSLRPLVNL
jgi:hypothetical protein